MMPRPSQADTQPLVSATYIPQEPSFGPGVGIPPLYLYEDNSEAPSSDNSRTTSATTRYPIEFSTSGPMEDFPESQPEASRSRYPNLTLPLRDAQNHTSSGPPTATMFNPQRQQSNPGSSVNAGNSMNHRHNTSNPSNTPNSPNGLGSYWPLNRVISWLVENHFSPDWQETFRALKIEGSTFLEVGRRQSGRANYSLMHQHIYPRLAKECSRSGSGWDQAREREEGLRMRKLIRKITETGGNSKNISSNQRDNFHTAYNDAPTDESPNISRQDLYISTPSTAGADEDSPGKQPLVRSPGIGIAARRASQNRSNTLPVFTNSEATSSEPNISDVSRPLHNRTAFTQSILGWGVEKNDHKRHSPRASSEAEAAGFPNDIRHREESPQSDSPVVFSARSSQGNSNVSPSPHRSFFGHQKTASTDSIKTTLAQHGSVVPPNASTGLRDQLQLRGLMGGSIGEIGIINKGQDPRRMEVSARQASSETPISAKEHRGGLFSKFRGRKKKDDSAHPSPEDISMESPTTSPLNHRPPAYPSRADMPFPQNPVNNSETSLDRPSSRLSMISDHEKGGYPGPRGRTLARANSSKKFIFATPDGWNYRLIDVSDTDAPDALRVLICQNLGIEEHEYVQIYLTEVGQTDHEEPLSDSKLLICRRKADNHASLKIFVKASAITPESLYAPDSAGIGIGIHPKDLLSPPMGGTFHLNKPIMDEETYSKLHRRMSSSPTLDSKASTLRPSEASDSTRTTLTNVGDSTDSPRERLQMNNLEQDRSPSETGSNETQLNPSIIAAAEEHRRQNEQKQRAYLEKKQLRTKKDSSSDANGYGIKRDGVINFDVPRVSPFEDKKQEALIPQRRPPPPPADSIMLIKANSLTKKNGAYGRPPSFESERRLSAEQIVQDIVDRNRRRAISNSNALNDEGIPGNKQQASAQPRDITHKRSQRPRALPLRRYEEKVSEGLSPDSAETSPNSPGFPQSLGNKHVDNIGQSTNFQSNPNTRFDNFFKPGPTSEVSPPNRPKLARAPSSRMSIGPNLEFKENEILFDKSPVIPQHHSEEDSDDGLFAVPLIARKKKLALGVADTVSDEPATDSDGRSGRPALTVNTRSRKGLSVSFKSPQTATTATSAATNSSSQTERDYEDSHSTQATKADRRVPISANSATWSAQSPDDMAKVLRRESFAREDVWASRPPAEALIDHLDDFFPNLDLDQPLALEEQAQSASPPPSPSLNSSGVSIDLDSRSSFLSSSQSSIGSSRSNTPMPSVDEMDTLGADDPTLRRRESSIANVAQRSIRKSGGLSRMKSIREVAKGAHEANRKRYTAPSQVDGKSSDTIQRRKSTKMFGANIVQIKPSRGGAVPRPAGPPVPQDLLPKRQATFKWFKGQLIGKGTYGRVYLGMNANTGEFLAVKQVEVSHKAGQDKDRVKEMVAALDQEIDTMQHLDHNNIVQYLGCERGEYSISIFLEYISGGSVGSCLRKHGKFEESVVCSLTRQTLDGLAYLHGQGILHRDLKADNILLDLDGTCKISDFGISKKTDNIYGNDITNSMQGSVFWMAPEVIRSEGQGYSAKVDIWSLGCVVLEMFAGRRPWPKDEAIGAIYKLGSLQAPPIPEDVSSNISAAAFGLILDCFQMQVEAFPTHHYSR
ncbi:MAG: hypothetical protein M1829_002530 [Trizodia sp. TS-e1964]|nr:MAG: hypothetical protein M1829_002530 [Trizodia sp. TS-e1964]